MNDVEKFEQRSPGVPATQEPTDIVMMAIQQKLDPGLIEKMMDLAERNEKNEARKAFNQAMTKFKADPPDIEKDKTVSFGSGKTSYAHASLANVTKKISKALSAQGLSANWQTEQTDALIKVTCTICHFQGHCESTSLSAAPDTSGSKNSIQAIGSTISYLERYTLLAITGLATHDMDDDAVASEPPEPITEEQIANINTRVFDLMKAEKIKDDADFAKRLKKLYKVATVDELTDAQGNALLKKLSMIK